MTSMKREIKLSENAQIVAESRYFMEGEDWNQCCQRVAKYVSSQEKNHKEITDKFYEMIYNMDFIPGGRILRNSGKPKGSLLNCYHLPINDSIEEIGQFMKESLILWSEGGGVGANFSNLRPKGDPIMGKGGQSSGMVSFLIACDQIAKTIESGGQRRAAGLASLEVSHPEICDFIDSKMVDGAISYFNISVMVNDEFLEAVESDGDWELKFKQRVYKKIKARVIWDKIVSNMIKHAEPGLLNTTNMFKNNSYYYDPVTGCNPCGEAILAPHDACCLGSLVLPNFITGIVNTNWQKLERVIKLGVRFLDNVLDVNKYTLRRIDEKAHKSRRIGLGVMGLADYLFAKQLRYGSKEALIEIEKLFKFIRDVSYQSSVELAMEKGSFPAFDSVAYGKASFVRKLPASLRMDIKEKGIRNVTILSQAPTGTISLLCETCSGIEPLIFKGYKRSDRVGDRIYIHPKYQQLLESGNEIPDWFVDMTDLEPKDHFETQAIIQRYIDGATSKTINLPKGTTVEQLDKLLLEYIHDLKGVTVYVDGSREGQIYNKLTDQEARDYLSSKKLEVKVMKEIKDVKDEEEIEEVKIVVTNEMSEDDVACKGGMCSLDRKGEK